VGGNGSQGKQAGKTKEKPRNPKKNQLGMFARIEKQPILILSINSDKHSKFLRPH